MAQATRESLALDIEAFVTNWDAYCGLVDQSVKQPPIDPEPINTTIASHLGRIDQHSRSFVAERQLQNSEDWKEPIRLRLEGKSIQNLGDLPLRLKGPGAFAGFPSGSTMGGYLRAREKHEATQQAVDLIQEQKTESSSREIQTQRQRITAQALGLKDDLKSEPLQTLKRVWRSNGILWPIPAGEFTATSDYRSINLRGRTFSLTPNQAEVIKQLHKAYGRGTPDLATKQIQALAGIAQSKISDIFKSLHGWQTLIVSPRRGAYRLNIKSQ